MYESVKEFVQNTNQSFWDEYSNGHQVWGFTEFGFRCDNWEAFYRAIYTCPLYEGQQMLLDFARPENVILTNIGISDDVLQHCSQERKKYWLDLGRLNQLIFFAHFLDLFYLLEILLGWAL